MSKPQVHKEYGNIWTWGEFGGTRYHFKSEAEFKWGCYLQFLKNSGEIRAWSYETKKFIFEGVEAAPVQYTPDFQIIDKNGSEYYQEYKGTLDGKAISRFRRMSQHFPDVVMELVLLRLKKKGAEINRRAFALKYCRRIVVASEIYKQLKSNFREP